MLKQETQCTGFSDENTQNLLNDAWRNHNKLDESTTYWGSETFSWSPSHREQETLSWSPPSSDWRRSSLKNSWCIGLFVLVPPTRVFLLEGGREVASTMTEGGRQEAGRLEGGRPVPSTLLTNSLGSAVNLTCVVEGGRRWHCNIQLYSPPG